MHAIAIFKCSATSKYKYLILYGKTMEYGAAIYTEWGDRTVSTGNMMELVEKIRSIRAPKILPRDNSVFNDFVKNNGNPVFMRRFK